MWLARAVAWRFQAYVQVLVDDRMDEMTDDEGSFCSPPFLDG